MAKYAVEETEGFEDTRVFRVGFTNEQGRADRLDVWVNSKWVGCVGCQSPLCGMSGSCPHAKAVKRHLQKPAAAPERTEKRWRRILNRSK